MISASGLRGRGGAGFPTGRKWSLARAQPAPKYVICNGDEGDPGAFMDRLVLESDPHRVVEGLAIAACAMGAEEGLFYIRAEYPQAVRRIREAIRQAEERGLLGERVLDSDLRLHFEVREGAGRLRLRRGDRAHRVARGIAGHAPAAPALPGGEGLPRASHRDQQRRDPRLRAVDRAPRRRGLRRPRHRLEQGHQGLRPGRQDPPRRPHRGADGDHHPQDRRGPRRRRAGGTTASRRCSSADRRAAASPRAWPTPRSTTRRCGRAARSWAPAASWCSTTATAWSTWPASSCASPATSRAASAPSAGSGPGACSRSSTGCAPARAGRKTSRTSRSWPTASPAPACAVSARPPPTRC